MLRLALQPQLLLPLCFVLLTGNSVCIQHPHHYQNHNEHAHVNAEAHDQNLCQSAVSPGGIAQGLCTCVWCGNNNRLKQYANDLKRVKLG